MLHWGLGLVAVIIPVQMFLRPPDGRVRPRTISRPNSPRSRRAGRHSNRRPRCGSPSRTRTAERNLFAIEVPKLGSFIASGNLDRARGTGSKRYPPEDRPPVVIPFFAFRLMVGMGLMMLAVSWFGNWLRWRGRLDTTRWFLWCAFLSFPTGFVAVLAGWFTAEVGRQPWVVYGLLRTKDAVTPSLTGPLVLATLLGYVVVYAVIFTFGSATSIVLLREGPTPAGARLTGATAMRPMAAAGPAETATGS